MKLKTRIFRKNQYCYNQYFRRPFHKNSYERDHYTSFSLVTPSRMQYALYIIKKLWSNRSLRIYFIASVIIIKVLFALIFLFVIPSVGITADYLHHNTVKEIFEFAAGFIDKIWNGA